jgi:hypothetical protein
MLKTDEQKEYSELLTSEVLITSQGLLSTCLLVYGCSSSD